MVILLKKVNKCGYSDRNGVARTLVARSRLYVTRYFVQGRLLIKSHWRAVEVLRRTCKLFTYYSLTQVRASSVSLAYCVKLIYFVSLPLTAGKL